MLILSEAQVRKCLTMERCIAASRLALSALRRRRDGGVGGDQVEGTSSTKRQAAVESSSGLAHGVAVIPKRIVLPPHPPGISMETTSMSSATALPSSQPDTTLFKPAAYFHNDDNNDTEDASSTQPQSLMGMKVISVRSNNPSRGKPSAPATVAMLDVQTGEITAILGATYLTAARTAAGSAIATELCLQQKQKKNDRNDGSDGLHLVVLGAGIQAELHIRALKYVLKDALSEVTIVNRTAERAEKLKHRLKYGNNDNGNGDGGGGGDGDGDNILQNTDIHVRKLPTHDPTRKHPSPILLSLKKTIQSANIIVTATNTPKPLINWNEWVSDGCHVNGIGSYLPEAEEVDCTFVRDRCVTVVDTMEALDAGDLKHINRNSDTFVGLVGELLAASASSAVTQNDDNTTNNTTDGDDGTSCDSSSNIIERMRAAREMSVDGETTNKCTFYKAVGTAIQDIVTAQSVVEAAQELEIGTNVEM